jgi:hypothetical protein
MKLNCPVTVREVNPQINRIYKKLTETFRNPSPPPTRSTVLWKPWNSSLPSRRTTSPKRVTSCSMSSCRLPSLPPTQEKKWEASRLAMHGAYKWDKFLPRVEDPQDILTFLDHHFDWLPRWPKPGRADSERFASAGLRLRSRHHRGSQDFDPTNPRSFAVSAACSRKTSRPSFARPLSSSSLSSATGGSTLLAQSWRPDQMRSLCVDWASAVDRIEHTTTSEKATLVVLLGMINSPHWRPHIVRRNGNCWNTSLRFRTTLSL